MSLLHSNHRKYPIGAEIIPGRGVDFRVWAPRCNTLEVIINNTSQRMEKEDNGYFSYDESRSRIAPLCAKTSPLTPVAKLAGGCAEQSYAGRISLSQERQTYGTH